MVLDICGGGGICMGGEVTIESRTSPRAVVSAGRDSNRYRKQTSSQNSFINKVKRLSE